MPLPQWLARFNRRWLNPGAVRRGKWPVLVHPGRKSGNLYRTPLDAYPTAAGTGYVFTINYGPRSDWHRNVMAAGSAVLEVNGESVELTNPRLLPVDDAYRLLPDDAKTPPGLVGVENCLVVDTSPLAAT